MASSCRVIVAGGPPAGSEPMRVDRSERASDNDGQAENAEGTNPEVARRLAIEYPDAVCELDHRDAWELLVATILSAQTTDARVNMVTPELFRRYPTPADLAEADPGEVAELIRSTGFYQNKTRSILGMAAGGRRALRRRGALAARGPRDAARCRAQDGQRRAQRRLRPPRAAGRHARREAVAPPRPHRAERPGQGRARAQRLPARGASGGRSACG